MHMFAYERHPQPFVIFMFAVVLATAVDHRNRYYQSGKTRNGHHQGRDCKWKHHQHYQELVQEQPTSQATLSTAAPMLVSILHLCPWTAENVPPRIMSGVSSATTFLPAYPAPVLATTPASHVIAAIVLLGRHLALRTWLCELCYRSSVGALLVSDRLLVPVRAQHRTRLADD